MLSHIAPFESNLAGDPLAAELSGATCHELYAARTPDAAAMSGLALVLIQRTAPQAILWVRQTMIDCEAGCPYPPGLAELGIDPGRLILVRAPDSVSALQAGLEGARCPALGAVLIELWGEAKAFDLTASRRLVLAARKSGVPLLLTRVAARPQPSAAASRWQVAAAPSRPRAANAPGSPAFALTLLRGRDRSEGARHHLEWDRDARSFAPLATRRETLSRALAAVSLDRTGATGRPGTDRRTG